jgi:hypothetical protein
VTVRVCDTPSCTASTTGICMLHPDQGPEKCPHVQTTERLTDSLPIASADKPLPPRQQFHLGIEFGTEDMAAMSQSLPIHLLGLIGTSGVGKTALITSLYLLASHGMIADVYRFGGSQSLRAFEDRARGFRSWQHGVLPDKVVPHTVRGDPRSPSLLHLTFQDIATGRHINFLITDLPGEWTTGLVHHASHAPRFSFLKRADSVVLVIDGERLARPEHRHAECQMSIRILQRLAEDVNIPRDVPLILVVSKADLLVDIRLPQLENVARMATSLGYQSTTVHTAAFSRSPEITPNGLGIKDLMKAVTRLPRPAASEMSPVARSERAFLRYRA